LQSNSDKAQIRLVEKGAHVRFEVRDWGTGFEPNSVKEKCFGLAGIWERVRAPLVVNWIFDNTRLWYSSQLRGTYGKEFSSACLRVLCGSYPSAGVENEPQNTR